MNRLGKIREFAIIGVIVGLLQSGIAIAYYTSHPDASARTGLAYWTISGIYVAGGLVGGAFFGALKPYAVTRPRAALTGVLVTFPEFCALTGGMIGRSSWFPAGFIIAAAASLIIGAGLAVVFLDESRASLK